MVNKPDSVRRTPALPQGSLLLASLWVGTLGAVAALSVYTRRSVAGAMRHGPAAGSPDAAPLRPGPSAGRDEAGEARREPARKISDEHDPRTPQHPAPHRDKVRVAALWYGLFGGFLALTIQVLADYGLASYVCFAGAFPLAQAGPDWAWWSLVGISAFSILLAASAVAVAWMSWGASRRERSGDGDDRYHSHELLEVGEGRTRFMAMAGLLTSGVLLATSLFHATALFISPLCRQLI